MMHSCESQSTLVCVHLYFTSFKAVQIIWKRSSSIFSMPSLKKLLSLLHENLVTKVNMHVSLLVLSSHWCQNVFHLDVLTLHNHPPCMMQNISLQLLQMQKQGLISHKLMPYCSELLLRARAKHFAEFIILSEGQKTMFGILGIFFFHQILFPKYFIEMQSRAW